MQTSVTSQASPGPVTELVSLLNWSLGPIQHDRWLVAALRDRRLRTVAQSQSDPDNPYQQLREVQPPAWRCLLSNQAICVTQCRVSARAAAASREWELEWPAVLYAPVGVPGRRGEGLLILANLRPHAYCAYEIRYVSLLAQGLLHWVAFAAGSQSALSELLPGGAPSRAATLQADWPEQPPSPDLPDRLQPLEVSRTHLVSADLSAAGGSAPVRLPERDNQRAAGKTEPFSQGCQLPLIVPTEPALQVPEPLQIFGCRPAVGRQKPPAAAHSQQPPQAQQADQQHQPG